jgi:hypothetical protein
MNMDTVRSISRRYGVDLRGVRVRIRADTFGYFGVTDSRQRISLTRDAFANEQEMARTLYHERFHVGQLRGGTPYPRTDAEVASMEREAHAAEQRWWDTHPLNPDNRSAEGRP